MGKKDTSEHFPLMAPGFMAKVPQLQILLVSAQPGLGLVDQPGGATQSRADACLSGAERWGIIAGGAKSIASTCPLHKPAFTSVHRHRVFPAALTCKEAAHLCRQPSTGTGTKAGSLWLRWRLRLQRGYCGACCS